MYYGYYGTMVPAYRTYHDERFVPALVPLTAGLLGLGIGYLGAQIANRPYCCFPFYGPYPPFYPGFKPWIGPYGYPGIKPYVW